MTTLQTHFDQFLKERQYLKNVAPRTVEWYKLELKLFSKSGQTELTQRTVQNFVIALRERGVSGVSLVVAFRWVVSAVVFIVTANCMFVSP
jgi:hypothetical protein